METFDYLCNMVRISELQIIFVTVRDNDLG